MILMDEMVNTVLSPTMASLKMEESGIGVAFPQEGEPGALPGNDSGQRSQTQTFEVKLRMQLQLLRRKRSSILHLLKFEYYFFGHCKL
jgi:hypothetical protein